MALWCFLCSTEFPDGTPGRNAKGCFLCMPCSETPRGKTELEDPYTRDRRLFGDRPGSHVKGMRFKKALERWMR